MKITVLGAGTWGTALTILLAENKHKVTIWSKLQREIEEFLHQKSSGGGASGVCSLHNQFGRSLSGAGNDCYGCGICFYQGDCTYNFFHDP